MSLEDKAFVQDSFGHQDDVLAIDALRKERAISVGRDRTMQLHKVKNSIFFHHHIGFWCTVFESLVYMMIIDA